MQETTPRSELPESTRIRVTRRIDRPTYWVKADSIGTVIVNNDEEIVVAFDRGLAIQYKDAHGWVDMWDYGHLNMPSGDVDFDYPPFVRISSDPLRAPAPAPVPAAVIPGGEPRDLKRC